MQSRRSLCKLPKSLAQAGVSDAALCAIAIMVFLVPSYGCSKREIVKPLAKENIEVRAEQDGNVYFLADNGNAYREVVPDEQWEFIDKVFDPNEFTQSYVAENNVTYRISPETGERFEVLQTIEESFEDLNTTGASGLQQLVSPKRLRWGSFTLQSPMAPSIPAYVELRNKILDGESDFLDCIVEPTNERAHSGKTALKCVAPAKPDSMVTCKASLSSPLVYFRNGDDFWYEAFYWVDDNYPLTVMDLECEFVKEHPGIRVRFYDDGYLGVELKALSKPQFHQPRETQVKFPIKQWVSVRVHFQLSTTDGKIEIWQDGRLVLSTNGPTLPFRSAIYNSLEIGISAHSDSSGATLYMDDMRVSANPF